MRELAELPLWETRRDLPDWVDENDPDAEVPIVTDPSQFILMATPGGNVISSLVPTWGHARGVVRPIGR